MNKSKRNNNELELMAKCRLSLTSNCMRRHLAVFVSILGFKNKTSQIENKTVSELSKRSLLKWTTPTLIAIALPVHAQTSTAGTESEDCPGVTLGPNETTTPSCEVIPCDLPLTVVCHPIPLED